MTLPAQKIVVIGGGISGLAAALRLRQRSDLEHFPLEITLLEASARLGGLLHSTQRDGFLLEGGADCLLSSKRRGVEFCRELGLSDQLITTRPENRQSFIVRDGTLHPVPEGFYLLAPSQLRPFLTTPLLSWRGKWRALAEPLLPARDPGDESLASFVRRRLGQEVLDWLAQPLLAGIYAADPEALSLKATFPEFLEMERKYGSVLLGVSRRGDAVRHASGARYSLFASLRDGMETLARRATERLAGVSLRTSTPARRVRHSEQGWEIELERGERLLADGVCLALPAHQCGRLLALQSSELAADLNAIPYSTSITINLAFDESAIAHPMNGVGFVTPAIEKQPAVACTFVHRKFEGRVPPGKALLRAFIGGNLPDDFFSREDRDLESLVLNDLARLLGIEKLPLFSAVSRWPLAMPQYIVGHTQRLLKIEETVLGLPGLTLAGNWQWGVGLPDCIESGERAANQLIDRLTLHPLNAGS